MLYLLVAALCARVISAGAIWERSFAEQPDPGRRDHQQRDYFVAEMADPAAAAHNGWSLEEPFPIADHWLFSVPKGSGSVRKRSAEAAAAGARHYYGAGMSTLRRRAPVPRKNIQQEFHIEDPLFKDQWHIYNSEEEHHDMNVVPVWRRNITGHGVTVAIVDDGLEYDHPDFEESFSKEGSWDYNLFQNLPKPLLEVDTHGTRCAGEVAAGINNACGVGIAPGAKVAGIRILSGDLTRADEARALIHRYQINDIYSCSWGPDDNGKTIDGPPPLVKRAELDGIERGRDGKGSIYVVASGNGKLYGDNCNYDGYTNSIYSITIGAIDRHNAIPYYAESCSANMVVTYSSNHLDKITTTDRLNPLKPDEVKCTSQHSGTSAAAPIAAGVFALVLQQRPDLTWRDLQYLVRDTAKPFDIVEPVGSLEVANWTVTADKHLYHNSFGYGLLDADAIVTRAESWELVKPQTWYFMPQRSEHAPLGQLCEVGVTVSPIDWEEANMDHIEHVRVRVSYEHDYRGALAFQLVSPMGIVSDLAAQRPRDISSAPVDDWEFMSVVHWGEAGEGHWKLRVFGNNENAGVLKSWQLKFFGQAKDVSLVRRYSEVWDQYEPQAELIEDAASLQSSTGTTEPGSASTGSASEPSSDTLSAEPSTTLPATGSAPLGDSTTTSSSSATSSADSSEETDSKGDQETSSPPHDNDSKAKSPHHSVLYYIVVSMIGVGIIVLCAAPIILLRLKRQANFGESAARADYNDSQFLDDEFELDDFDDEAEEADVSDYNVFDEDRRRSQDGPDANAPTEAEGLLDRP